MEVTLLRLLSYLIVAIMVIFHRRHKEQLIKKFPALIDIYTTTPTLKTVGALWKKSRKTARPNRMGNLLGNHVSYAGQGSCPRRSQAIWQPKKDLSNGTTMPMQNEEI